MYVLAKAALTLVWYSTQSRPLGTAPLSSGHALKTGSVPSLSSDSNSSVLQLNVHIACVACR